MAEQKVINLEDGGLPLMSAQEILETNYDSVGDGRSVDEGRNIFKYQLNIAIEMLRATFTSRGSIQSMVYEEKVAQATDFLVDGGDVSKYPLLAVEVDVTGKNANDVADNILTQRSEWLKKICKTEEIKMVANGKMQRARSYDGVVKAFKAAQAEIKAFDL